MEIPVEILVGPAAGLALALAVIWTLWQEHRKSDDDVRAQRDRNAAGWEEQTGASSKAAAAAERTAAALETLASERAARRRFGDGERE